MNNRFSSRIILVVGLWIALLGTVARAQYEDGSLTGTIYDATDAVVSDATVIVTNVNTGIATRVKTNGSAITKCLRCGWEPTA